MIPSHRSIRLAVAAALAAPAALAAGEDWRLAPEESQIAFVSVKAGEIAEAHRFLSVAGDVSADGAARIEIDLASVDTGIDIRDARMKEMLFEIDRFAVATFTADVDLSAFESLAVGERRKTTIDGELSLHGVAAAVSAPAFVTRIGENRVTVETAAPALLAAGEFGLEGGVERLREVAGLPSITPVVPVTASLVFER